MSLIAAAGSGGLWGMGTNAAAGVSAAASTTIPSDATIQIEIKGSSAEELSQALFDATKVVGENYIKQHESLEQEVQGVLDRVEGLRAGSDRGGGKLIPIRPDIVDGVNGDDFFLPPQ